MRRVKYILILSVISFLSISGASKNNTSKVKLVVQIVVDQLRGDIINKFRDNLSKEGFLLLEENGLNFTNANFIHSVTKTAPGHATIATGSIPALHGIIGNDWYDAKLGKQVYACEDKNSKVFGEEKGLSPKNLVVSTISDEIFLATEGKAKIFGVSLKDRGAIFLAGHSGKAFWFSKRNKGFTSSKYYFNELPEYTLNFNNLNLVDKYYNNNWKLLLPKEKYVYNNKDENEYERTEGNLGKTFPHSFADIDENEFGNLIAFTPYGDKITSEFAKVVIEKNEMGKDEIVDYFSVSFSSTDYIGHRFSPNSLEYEDQIYRLDRIIADFLKFLNDKIGLENILLIFTADHGVAESPEFLETQKQPSGVLSTSSFVILCNNFGYKNYKIDFNLVKDLIPPYIYLNETEILKTGLNICKVENDLRKIILKDEGIYDVFTQCSVELNEIVPNQVNLKVANSFYPGRSGNLYLVNMPGWYMSYNSEERENSSTHGTPWNYDTFVPLIFMGPGIPNGFDSSESGPQDIAPTIANFLGIKKPSGSVGRILIK